MLSRNGVGMGDAVHLALTNSPAFIALWLATVRLGAWLVPSDPMGATPEIAGHIERTKPRVGFCATSRSDVYRAAAPADVTVFEVSEADTALDIFGDELQTGWPTPTLTQRAAVMFTSGTTGRPKGVEITQANYAFAGRTMAEASNLAPHHRQFVVLPLFHANAQYYSFAAAIWVGASVALTHTFSATRFLAQAARHRVTHASLFAAPIRMILARGGAPIEGSKLEHCWYAMNLSHQHYETLTRLLGCRPRQLYGMTETIPAVLSESPFDTDTLTLGYATGTCKVDVRDGEIVVGGDRGITLFAGYLDDPQTTDASFVDGWFQTGDKAHLDGYGRFVFDGRRADILKVAGENVSTVEIEEVLAAHPDVLEVAVVGHPDEIRDEVPIAFVVLTQGAVTSVDDLHEWCRDRLTKSKRPRDIALVEQLPRTSVGKIRKFLLRDSGTVEAT
jgi:crotonobetaine/carnitine-CoA ligase